MAAYASSANAAAARPPGRGGEPSAAVGALTRYGGYDAPGFDTTTLVKPASFFSPISYKSVAFATATARGAPPNATTAAYDDGDAAAATAYWAYVDRVFPRERRMYSKRRDAKKAYKLCTDSLIKRSLKTAYKSASVAYKKLRARVNAAYDKANQAASDSDAGADSDYAPDSDASDATAYDSAKSEMVASDSESPSAVRMAGKAHRQAEVPEAKRSKPPPGGPATGPIKPPPTRAKKNSKPTRAKKNSKPKKELENGCACGCGGSACGYAQKTSEVRYDMTTNLPTCLACRVRQNKAFDFVHMSLEGNGRAPSVMSACWLNQGEDVRVNGFGRGNRTRERHSTVA
jgi:hypothetical protein